MSEKPTSGVSRRSMLKTTGLGLTATPTIVGALSAPAGAASTYPYDVIQNNQNSTTIRYTKNSVWDNLIKISVSSTVNHFGSFFTSDNRWNHKFGIDTQALAYHTGDDALRSNIGNHSTEIQKIGNTSMEINGKPVGSGYVGATPSNVNDEVENVFMTVLQSTASLLNQAFAVASSATAIANSLEEFGSKSCDAAADCEMYEWSYWSDKEEVAHQTKWWATTAEDEWGNFEAITQADSETAISFIASVGPDYGDTGPGTPPSSISVHDNTTTESAPGYVTREELQDLRSRAESGGGGLSRPQAMSVEKAQQYGVQRLGSPRKIIVNGERKTATHVATNAPVMLAALEPQE